MLLWLIEINNIKLILKSRSIAICTSAFLSFSFEWISGKELDIDGTVLVNLFCNTLFDKYLLVTSLHWC